MASEDVNIVIGAQDKASSVLDNVAAKAGSFSTSFAAMGPVVAGVGAVIGAAAAGFTALSFAIEGTAAAANKIDALTDTAAGLGERVGDLQAFQFAMGEAGNVDADKSIDALKKVQRAIGEIASGGNDKGSELFARLGIDAQELSMQGPIDQFMTLKDAIGGIENISERASVAQQLLGKSASDLIPALIAESDEFAASMQAANDFGTTVSDEGAAGIAAMNDAIGRTQAGMEGLYNQIAVAVAPAIEAAANSLNAWLPPIIQAAEVTLPIVVDIFVQIAGYAVDILNVLGRIQAYDFKGAMDLASNMQTAEQWSQKVAESRANAARASEQAESKRLAMLQAANSFDEKAAEAAAKRAEAAAKTVSDLERQLQVARIGEEAVKKQEQLALATNDAERERIALLQEQIDKQEEQNEIAKKADELSKKQAEEKAKKDEEIAKKLAMPAGEVKATESRLLSRGPSDGPLQGILEENKEQKRLAQEQLKVSEEANRLLRERQNTLQLEFVG